MRSSNFKHSQSYRRGGPEILTFDKTVSLQFVQDCQMLRSFARVRTHEGKVIGSIGLLGRSRKWRE